MRLRRWFLPENPDVLGVLQQQTDVTVEGVEALVAWADGDPGAADRLRACEHRADACKRQLRQALSVAFSTPLEPEDLFELSSGIDELVNGAKNAVREAEVMQAGPDEAIAEMAAELAEGTRHIAAAFGALAAGSSTDATEAADAAVSSQRRIEKLYRAAMSALVDTDDLREVAAKRELYRRLSRTSDELVRVAERVWYAVLKQS
ncbi:MAG TPA: DUF47 family protein [Thermoleophilaceae bacterium]|jgi:uncharacterized protein Yka (UPF0111/DUF47 family)